MYSCFIELLAIPPKMGSYFPSLYPCHLENTHSSEDFSDPSRVLATPSFVPITPNEPFIELTTCRQDGQFSTQSSSMVGSTC